MNFIEHEFEEAERAHHVLNENIKILGQMVERMENYMTQEFANLEAAATKIEGEVANVHTVIADLKAQVAELQNQIANNFGVTPAAIQSLADGLNAAEASLEADAPAPAPVPAPAPAPVDPTTPV